MAVSPEFTDYVVDLMAPVGAVAPRRMFGGVGIFYRDLMFALIAGDVLYLKVDDTTRADFEAAGVGPFTYETKKGTRGLRGYWRAPDEVMENEDEFALWARDAVDVALRADAAKAKKKRKPKA